jgi:hypothetical protein
MHIEKLIYSSVLKRGESLIVLKCSKRCHEDVLTDLRKSLGTRFIRFYRHRQEPVPWVRRWKNGRCFRRPRTTNERRAYCAANTNQGDPRRSRQCLQDPAQNGFGIDCQLLTTISFFGISEAGKSTVEPTARMQKASIVESTALHFGDGESHSSHPVIRCISSIFTAPDLSDLQ